jgi:hypothetical protein
LVVVGCISNGIVLAFAVGVNATGTSNIEGCKIVLFAGASAGVGD